MNPMQKSYGSFIESVCKQFDCTGAIRPLQEGFDALCESMTPGNQELVRYFRNLKPSSMPKDFSEMDGDVFTKHNPHFDRWVSTTRKMRRKYTRTVSSTGPNRESWRIPTITTVEGSPSLHRWRTRLHPISARTVRYRTATPSTWAAR